MSFLIDSDICSLYLKGHRQVGNRFVQHFGGLHVSVVTAAELYTWAFRRSTSAPRAQGVLDLLVHVTLIDVDPEVARRFGEVRAALLDRGRPLPAMDLLIASTALHHDLTLVTHNTADFADIPGLRLVDWIT